MTYKVSPLTIAVATLLAVTASVSNADPAKQASTQTPATSAQLPPPPPPPGMAPPPAAPVAPKVPLVAPPGVAATVNGQDIKLSEVQDLAMSMSGKNALDQLIQTSLVDQEAKKQGVTVTTADLDAKKNEIRGRLGTQTLEQALTQHNMTMAQLEDRLKQTIEVEKLTSKDVTPPSMVHIREILIMVSSPGMPPQAGATKHTDAEAMDIAKKIIADLKSGKKFEDLEKQYNEDPGTKTKGGDLGMVYKGASFDPNFLTGVLDLKKGDVTPAPVKSYAGYHVVQAISTTADHPSSENDLYKTAVESARSQQVNSVAPAYMKGLHDKGNVINYLYQ